MSKIAIRYLSLVPDQVLHDYFYSFVQESSQSLSTYDRSPSFRVGVFVVEPPLRGSVGDFKKSLWEKVSVVTNTSRDLSYLLSAVDDPLTEGAITLEYDAQALMTTAANLADVVGRYFGGASIVHVGSYLGESPTSMYLVLLVHATIIKNAAEMVRELNNLGVQTVTLTENIRPIDDEAVGVGPVETETSDVIVGLTDEDGVVYMKSETAPAQTAASDVVVSRASGVTSLAAFGVALFLLIWWNDEDK